MLPDRRHPPPVLILGSGVVAMTAALALARIGDVALSVRELGHEAPPRVDALPLPLLALLVELGVHPAMLGVDRVHEDSLSTWENPVPSFRPIGRKVHVDRRRLEQALLDLVERHAAIRITTGATPEGYERVVDATGRRALTATSIREPPTRWLARAYSLSGSFSAAEAALRIAPLQAGYCYRLGTHDLITLGFVVPAEAARTSDQIAAQLAAAGADWIHAGLPPLDELEAGRGGVASVQWSVEGSAAARIGDADFAFDALASQGIANGMSDAMHLDDPPAAREERAAHRRTSHVAHLLDAIGRCRFGEAPAWRDYCLFLREAAAVAA